MLTDFAEVSPYIALFVLIYLIEEALIALWDNARCGRSDSLRAARHQLLQRLLLWSRRHP